MKRIIIAILALVLAAAALCACAADGNVVAEVNGVQITREFYNDRLSQYTAGVGLVASELDSELGAEQAAELREAFLDALIMQEIILQYAAEKGITLTEAEKQEAAANTEAYLENMRNYFLGEAKYAASGTDAAASYDEEAQRLFDEFYEKNAFVMENLVAQSEANMIMAKAKEYFLLDSGYRVEDIVDETAAMKATDSWEDMIAELQSKANIKKTL